MEFSHVSVLLNETIDSLSIRPDGIYVDCTAGGGGHSAEILKRLSNDGRLVLIDQDPDAIKVLKKKFESHENVLIVHDNFSNLASILSGLGVKEVDGILADLGVSSHQLDDSERGFSFHTDAPLDMRMSKEGMSAKDVVNTYSEQELSNIIFKFGEEKFSRQIARGIVKKRQEGPILTTLELAQIVKEQIPAKFRRTGGHPARKTFQAIRIEVNGELTKLNDTLSVMFDSLKKGGRLSIITFHSLEDRIVKTFFKEKCTGCTCPPEFPICVCGKTPDGMLPFKMKKAGEKELLENPRSRSATLRTIEKIK